MRLLKRWTAGAVVTVMATLSAATSGAVLPAQAAGPTIVVDNTGHCKNSLPSLMAGVMAAGVGPAKIVVCPGTYAEAVNLSGAHDVQFIAKKGVTLVPPGPAFAGAIIAVDGSTNISIRGFTFDGSASLDTGAIAIIYRETSGRIFKNRFNHWQAAGMTQAIMASVSSPLPLRITDNRFTGYGGVGIDLYGETEPVVTGNKLDSVASAAIGIRTTGQNGGRIASNRLSNVSFPVSNASIGIDALNSNRVRIADNRLTHFNVAIAFGASCASSYGLTADFNQVIRNRITQTALPIYLAVNTVGGSCAVQANNNLITRNIMVDTGTKGVYGIQVQTLAASGTANADSEVVKNNLIKHFNGPTPSTVASGAGAAVPTGVFGPNIVLP